MCQHLIPHIIFKAHHFRAVDRLLNGIISIVRGLNFARLASLGGNQYNAQPQTGIYAGSYGTTLINNGNRSFNAVTTQQAGFFVKGQVRDIKEIKYKNERLLLVTKNNDSLSIFKIGKL